MPPGGPSCAAASMTLPRRATRRSASSSSMAPAAASALNSPSEWPAAAVGVTSRVLNPARLAQKIAGCWKRVPSSTRANGSSPTTSSARATRSGRTAWAAARMSSVWLPWPGKTTAVRSASGMSHTVPPPPDMATPSRVRTPRSGGFTGPGGGSIRKSVRLREQPAPLGVLDGLGAIADAELAIQRARVLLDGVGGEKEVLADLAIGGALGNEMKDLALALGEAQRRRRLAAGREHGHPDPDHPHRLDHVGRVEVLGHEAGRARPTRGLVGDLPGSRDQQNAGFRRGLAHLPADVDAGLVAGEQVHERHVGTVPAGEGDRGITGSRAQAAVDPRLLAQQEAKPPVHDVVVVDHEDAERLAHPSPSSSGTASRTSHCPASRAPASPRPPCAIAPSATSRRPMPGPPGRGRSATPSLRTASTKSSS